MNDLILDSLNEIKQLQNDIKLNELDYEPKSRNYNFSKIAYYILKKNIHMIFINKRC